MNETRVAAGLFKWGADGFSGGLRGGIGIGFGGKMGVEAGAGEDLRNKLSCVSFGGQFVRRIIEARERFASSDFSDNAHECPIISRCSNS